MNESSNDQQLGHPRCVAIGTDGARPVVWGLGDTEDAAIADARAHDVDGWDDQGCVLTMVTQETADRIEAGEVSCEALDIGIRVGVDGKIRLS